MEMLWPPRLPVRGIRLRLSNRPFRAFSVLALAVVALLGGCARRLVPPNLAAQMEAAQTPEDHARIALLLSARANEYRQEAAHHYALAVRYERSGIWLSYRHHDGSDLRMAEHCRLVAGNLQQAAENLTELARAHERIAQSLIEGP